MGSRITINTTSRWNAFYPAGPIVNFKNNTMPRAADIMPVTVTAVPVPTKRPENIYPGLLRTTSPVERTTRETAIARTASPTLSSKSVESKLLRILAEGGWHTLASLAKRTNMSKDSVGSALRRLRTLEGGNHNIVSNKGTDRKWRYANMANLARNDRRFAEGRVQAVAA